MVKATTTSEKLNLLKAININWTDSKEDSNGDFVYDNLRNKVPFAFARFNDGEMAGICHNPGVVVARGDQTVSSSLKAALTEAISHKQENYFIGITCPECQPFYFHQAGLNLTNGHNHIVRAVCTTNRNWARFIRSTPDSCAGKNIRFISGEDQNLSFLKNEMELNIIDHVTLPSKEAWEHVTRLQEYIKEVNDGDIVMISLGPTARVLCKEWFKEKPSATFIDIGSNFDPFTRDVWHKCHLGWENGFNIQNACQGCN